MPDDELLLRQRIELRSPPRPLVGDASGELQLPGYPVDRPHIFERIVGIEAGRLADLCRREGRSEMIGAEDELLDAVVPCRDRKQHGAHPRGIAHIAAREKGQCAEAYAAAQQIAAVDIRDQRPVLFKNALINSLCRTEDRW